MHAVTNVTERVSRVELLRKGVRRKECVRVLVQGGGHELLFVVIVTQAFLTIFFWAALIPQ
jgi:hypothetical protein